MAERGDAGASSREDAKEIVAQGGSQLIKITAVECYVPNAHLMFDMFFLIQSPTGGTGASLQGHEAEE